MYNKKQSDWRDFAKETFEDKSVAESFIALADLWTGSRGKLFTNHEQEKLEHINNYLNKQNNGEYITELSPKKAKSSLIRRVCVGQACITVNVMGIDYVLIQPPSIENRYQWKLPAESYTNLTEDGQRISFNQLSKIFLLKSASMECIHSLIEAMITTLRELNEELPFTTVLTFTDNEQHVWISANINKDISKTEYEIHNTLSFFDISQPYIELYSDDFYRYKNRRPERLENRKYHDIELKSELLNVHGNLISISDRVNIQQPILGDDNSGEFIWLPATPSIIEHLDAEPYSAVSKELIFSFQFQLESRVITPCFHENSLLESIIKPIKGVVL